MCLVCWYYLSRLTVMANVSMHPLSNRRCRIFYRHFLKLHHTHCLLDPIYPFQSDLLLGRTEWWGSGDVHCCMYWNNGDCDWTEWEDVRRQTLRDWEGL